MFALGPGGWARAGGGGRVLLAAVNRGEEGGKSGTWGPELIMASRAGASWNIQQGAGPSWRFRR